MDAYSLPVSLIRQYTFCPRVAYYLEVLRSPVSKPKWVQQGKVHQSRINELFKHRRLKKYGLRSARQLSEVSLFNESLKMHGRADKLLLSEDMVIPVEFKLRLRAGGKSHELQLCAYGMLAESEVEKQAPFGLLVGIKDGKTKIVEFSQDLRDKVSSTRNALLEMVESGVKPHSSASNNKCDQCEYLNLCNDRE